LTWSKNDAAGLTFAVEGIVNDITPALHLPYPFFSLAFSFAQSQLMTQAQLPAFACRIRRGSVTKAAPVHSGTSALKRVYALCLLPPSFQCLLTPSSIPLFLPQKTGVQALVAWVMQEK
jgi:hypothetical protein